MLSRQLLSMPARITLKSVLKNFFGSSSIVQAAASELKSNENVQHFGKIPEPKPLPVIRNLLQFKRNYPNLHEYLEKCSEEYGDIFKLETPGLH